MFNVGMTEMLLIGAIALLVLGPNKLPQFARSIGKGLTAFRRATNEFKSTVRTEFEQAAGPEAEDLTKMAQELRQGMGAKKDLTEALETAAKAIESGKSQFEAPRPADLAAPEVTTSPLKPGIAGLESVAMEPPKPPQPEPVEEDPKPPIESKETDART